MLQLTPQHLAASAPSGDSQTPPVFRLSTRSEAADGTQVHLHYFNPQYGTAAASALLGVADDDDDTIVEWPHNKNYGDVPPCTPAEQFSPTLESARYETQGSYLDDLTLLSSQLPPLRRAESCPPALHLLEREDELVLDFLQHSLSDESGNESNGHTSVNDTDDSDDDSDDGYGTGTIRLQLVAGGKQGGVSLPLTDRTPDTSPSLPLDAKTVKVSLPTADGGVRVSKHSADADDIALGSARKRRHNGSQRGRSRPEHLDDSETGDSDARNDDDSGELGDTVESLGENAYLDEATRVVNAKLRPFRPAGASSSRRTLARVHQQGMHGSSNGVMTAQLADGSEAPLAMGTGLSCHQCKKRHRADAVIFCRLTCDLHALFDKEAAAATNGVALPLLPPLSTLLPPTLLPSTLLHPTLLPLPSYPYPLPPLLCRPPYPLALPLPARRRTTTRPSRACARRSTVGRVWPSSTRPRGSRACPHSAGLRPTCVLPALASAYVPPVSACANMDTHELMRTVGEAGRRSARRRAVGDDAARRSTATATWRSTCCCSSTTSTSTSNTSNIINYSSSTCDNNNSTLRGQARGDTSMCRHRRMHRLASEHAHAVCWSDLHRSGVRCRLKKCRSAHADRDVPRNAASCCSSC
ncbi:MAG: hypothetical protein MHM6MM_003083 [Cercozoa sp. M6MM]